MSRLRRPATSTPSQLGTTATPSIARETSRRSWPTDAVSEGHLQGVQVLQQQQPVQGAEQDVQERHQGAQQLKDKLDYVTEIRGEERGPPLAHQKGKTSSSSSRADSNTPVNMKELKSRNKKQEEQEDAERKDQEDIKAEEDKEIQEEEDQVQVQVWVQVHHHHQDQINSKLRKNHLYYLGVGREETVCEVAEIAGSTSSPPELSSSPTSASAAPGSTKPPSCGRRNFSAAMTNGALCAVDNCCTADYIREGRRQAQPGTQYERANMIQRIL